VVKLAGSLKTETMLVITTTEKPRELVIADACRQLAEQRDLTSPSIRYQQMYLASKHWTRNGAVIQVCFLWSTLMNLRCCRSKSEAQKNHALLI
jgi:hypothetical protein